MDIVHGQFHHVTTQERELCDVCIANAKSQERDDIERQQRRLLAEKEVKGHKEREVEYVPRTHLAEAIAKLEFLSPEQIAAISERDEDLFVEIDREKRQATVRFIEDEG